MSSSSSCMCLDRRLVNVLVLSVGCVLLFSGFNTAQYCMKNVLEAERRSSEGRFTGDGYISLGILYLAFSFGNFFAPVVVDLLGARLTMIVGSTAYCIFILQFIFPNTVVLYLCSFLCGCGSSLLWVGQGVTIAQNSDLKTSDRNAGIFHSLLSTNGIWGNIFQYFVLRESLEITGKSRATLFAGLTGVTFLSACLFGIIRPMHTDLETPTPTTTLSDTKKQQCVTQKGLFFRIVTRFKNTFKMLRKSDSWLLLLTYLKTGSDDAVRTAILSAVVGHSLNLGQETKGLMGIAAISIATGGILAPGLIAGFSGTGCFSRVGRDGIFLFAFIMRTIDYYLIYMFFPIDSISQDSYKETFLPLSLLPVILTGFLAGFADGLATSSIQSQISVRYKDNSASAFALHWFARSMGCSFMFFFGSAFNLLSLLIFLSLFGTFATLGFCVVEWRFYKHLHKGKPAEEHAPLQSSADKQ